MTTSPNTFKFNNAFMQDESLGVCESHEEGLISMTEFVLHFLSAGYHVVSIDSRKKQVHLFDVRNDSHVTDPFQY